MGKKENNIQHQGIVKSIDSDKIEVMFVSLSACASCHAKGVCSVSDIKEKEVFVKNTGELYNLGEQVLVELEQSLGFKAVWFAYILPFFVVLSILVLFTALKFSELKAGIISLLSLIPYYFVLYLFKNKLSKTYSFKIKKLHNKY